MPEHKMYAAAYMTFLHACMLGTPKFHVVAQVQQFVLHSIPAAGKDVWYSSSNREMRITDS